MTNANRWILLLLVWNLGLLIAGGAILALQWQKTPAAEVVAATCAAQVTAALQDAHLNDE
jgi:hypothetical protein